jgi:hypothetical protein
VANRELLVLGRVPQKQRLTLDTAYLALEADGTLVLSEGSSIDRIAPQGGLPVARSVVTSGDLLSSASGIGVVPIPERGAVLGLLAGAPGLAMLQLRRSTQR